MALKGVHPGQSADRRVEVDDLCARARRLQLPFQGVSLSEQLLLEAQRLFGGKLFVKGFGHYKFGVFDAGIWRGVGLVKQR